MRIVLVATLLLMPVATATGGAWPRPAAGESASGDPELVLTFDDGPHEQHTPRILAELERRGLKAIFFWVGHRISGTRRHVDQRRAVAVRAVREGHLIGNHTIDHAQLCSGSRAEAARQLDQNAAMYRRLLGMPLLAFRAPYGARCNRLERMLGQRQLDHFHWDMDPHEWEHHDVALTVGYVKRKLRNLDGRGVLLLHDTKKVTVRALPIILDWIDAENARRERRGERPIRIISYVELAREQLAPGFEAWLRDAGDDVTGFGEAFSALIPGHPAARLGRR